MLDYSKHGNIPVKMGMSIHVLDDCKPYCPGEKEKKEEEEKKKKEEEEQERRMMSGTLEIEEITDK
jgi:epoxyqueuosine reductase QueG